MRICPDCKNEGHFCEEHKQWECSNGNCDYTGEIFRSNIRVVFAFDLEEDEATITQEDLEKWAKEINDNLACFIIGYEGWRVELDD